MGLFYFMNRDFKGVWIPKDIWLDENLTWMEKLLLVEIDSLDAEKGCFASNDYFAKFFQLSKSRISDLIGQLVSKGYITTFLLYEGKQVKRREITMVIPIRKFEGGIRKTEEGYSENAQDINTLVNNTISNTNKLNNKFIKPNSKEVNEYAKSIGFELSGDQFYDHYEARGWLIGKNPMKDWKAAVRTWKRNKENFSNKTTSQEAPKIKLK
jgi:hypothetical protein